ncbi:hypothetical protein M408DRAFT_326951 [Serendipita vermifera MAFF 305830]|uniref:N-acetyltransferase ECO1 n=1 Tax=Serendipita vermifera MAFF 305830 TaxID=933852 RepID=A0A0C3BJT6_SERVB|nr:hypothetical protein M408DRAFT_326951 [Serendipita vermifera MAFF 305830]
MSTERRKTYSKRPRTLADAVVTSPPSASRALKRPRDENQPADDESPAPKKQKTFKSSFKSTTKHPTETKIQTSKTPLRQLTLAVSSKSSMVSCNQCSLSYTRGAPEDEALHRSHCSSVLKGSEWSREDERDALKANACTVSSQVELVSGQSGRIISIRASVGGRLGTKIETVMSTMNRALSSPPLTSETLAASKVYLFLLAPSKSTRERIVGCVIAQNIKTAMKIVEGCTTTKGLMHVDKGVYCDPTPLPTSVGISRIFVARDCRRLGIAQTLLDGVARTFLHGCPLDPEKGQIAFSQPTGDGQKLMESWGKGGVRIYEES